MCRFVRAVSLLVAIACIAAMIFACRQSRLEACDPADSKAVCAQALKCLESHPASVCREYEKDAADYKRNFEKSIAPAYNGLDKALTY
jgi:hypothetical protein